MLARRQALAHAARQTQLLLAYEAGPLLLWGAAGDGCSRRSSHSLATSSGRDSCCELLQWSSPPVSQPRASRPFCAPRRGCSQVRRPRTPPHLPGTLPDNFPSHKRGHLPTTPLLAHAHTCTCMGHASGTSKKRVARPAAQSGLHRRLCQCRDTASLQALGLKRTLARSLQY